MSICMRTLGYICTTIALLFPQLPPIKSNYFFHAACVRCLRLRGLGKTPSTPLLSTKIRPFPAQLTATAAYAFFFPAAFAFDAFFLLLRIITVPKKDPTTAEPKRMRITGMRMAQTRGGNMLCKGWPSSTNG